MPGPPVVIVTEPAAVAPVPQPQPAAPASSGSASLSNYSSLKKALEGAKDLAKKGELINAETLLRAILNKDPKDNYAMKEMAKVQLRKGNAPEAAVWCKKMIKKRPKRASYRILYGDALAKMGDNDGARRQWKEALKIKPGNFDAKKRLAN